MSLMNRLSQLAKSPQGKDLVEKAKTFANDPKTREKIDEARDKLSGHVDTAKQKMAEKKAKDGGSSTGNGAATYGEETSAANTPTYGEKTPPSSPATADSPPTAPPAEPVDTTNPTYGEEAGGKPLYGEDGPKAA